jgi:hypothetical protein
MDIQLKSTTEPGVENVENVDNLKNDMDKSFPLLAERIKTPAENKEERQFLLKIDTTILPLLATVYFLASMVRYETRSERLFF